MTNYKHLIKWIKKDPLVLEFCLFESKIIITDCFKLLQMLQGVLNI